MVAEYIKFSDEIADAICDKLANGQSLASICAEDGMPNPSSVYRWLASNEAFREMYTRARDDQADTLADETISIADDARNDWMEKRGKEDPGWVVNGENIQRSKLRVETRKWFAAKLKPRKYGDKVEHTGSFTVNLESDATKL